MHFGNPKHMYGYIGMMSLLLRLKSTEWTRGKSSTEIQLIQRSAPIVLLFFCTLSVWPALLIAFGFNLSRPQLAEWLDGSTWPSTPLDALEGDISSLTSVAKTTVCYFNKVDFRLKQRSYCHVRWCLFMQTPLLLTPCQSPRAKSIWLTFSRCWGQTIKQCIASSEDSDDLRWNDDGYGIAWWENTFPFKNKAVILVDETTEVPGVPVARLKSYCIIVPVYICVNV